MTLSSGTDWKASKSLLQDPGGFIPCSPQLNSFFALKACRSWSIGRVSTSSHHPISSFVRYFTLILPFSPSDLCPSDSFKGLIPCFLERIPTSEHCRSRSFSTPPRSTARCSHRHRVRGYFRDPILLCKEDRKTWAAPLKQHTVFDLCTRTKSSA